MEEILTTTVIDYAAIDPVRDAPPAEGLWFRNITAQDVRDMIQFVLAPRNFSYGNMTFSKLVAMVAFMPPGVLAAAEAAEVCTIERDKVIIRRKVFRPWLLRLLLYCGISFMPNKIIWRRDRMIGDDDDDIVMVVSKRVNRVDITRCYIHFIAMCQRRAAALDRVKEFYQNSGQSFKAVMEYCIERDLGVHMMKQQDLALP
jgi:hypothetical protein